MLTLAEHTRIRRNDDNLTLTDVRVLMYLMEVVDRDGYAVATIAQIADALPKSQSSISQSLRRLIDTGRIERYGRRAFHIRDTVLRPHNRWGG